MVAHLCKCQARLLPSSLMFTARFPNKVKTAENNCKIGSLKI